MIITYENLVAAYDTKAHAEAAVKALKAAGFHDADISVVNGDRLNAVVDSAPKGGKATGIWHKLFGAGVFEHEAEVYGQVTRDGGVVLSLRVPPNEAAHAAAILDLHRPLNVHDRAITSGVAPAGHVETIEKALGAVPLADLQSVALSPKFAEANPEVVRLAEEHLEIGKNKIQTGKTRVRRFVTEKEVSADVTLHEEHAEIVRRAIDDRSLDGQIDWADKTIEAIETAEHAIARKTARIVEEISVRTVGSDHVETIRDKLRRQQAEVEHVGADGKTLA